MSEPGCSTTPSELLNEFFKTQAGLLQDAFEGARLKRFVLRHNNGAASLAQDEMRTGLAPQNITKSLQSASSQGAADIARQFHDKANTGSCTKWRRTR